jgi:hypothetical protein
MAIATPETNPTASAAPDNRELPAGVDVLQADPSKQSQPHPVEPLPSSRALDLRSMNATILEETLPVEPVYTPVLTNVSQIHPKFCATPTVLHEPVAPKEGQTLPIDACYPHPEDTIKLLNVEGLNYVQHMDSTLAIELQHNLINARHAHHAQLSIFDEQRSTLLSQLKVARDSELVHDRNVRYLNDRFMLKLNAALTQSGATKDAAQLVAISLLNTARDESLLALHDRQTIESCRMELLMLDNKRFVAANAFASAVHAVVLSAPAGQAAQPASAAVEAHEETEPAQSAISADMSAAVDIGTQNAEVTQNGTELDEDLRAKRLVELEQHPEIDRLNIDDVMYRILHVEANAVQHRPDETIGGTTPKSARPRTW